MRPVKLGARIHDPAPSLWHYRFQRVMMRPALRKLVLMGLPAFFVIFVAASWFAVPDNQAKVSAWSAGVWSKIEQRPEFLVKTMAIKGADPEAEAELRNTIQLEYPISSFDIDLDEIRALTETVPAVAAAHVSIEPGGVLEIHVSPRMPVALWRKYDGIRVIDDGGSMIRMVASRTDRLDLPLIAGEGAEAALTEAMSLFRNAGPLAPRIRGLVRMGERRWDVILDGGQRLMLPERHAVQALERVAAMASANELLARDVTIVDLRNPIRPTLRLGAEGVENMRAQNAALTGAKQ